MLSFRHANSSDLPQLIAILADDELGKTREDVTNLKAYEKAFEAIQTDPHHFILVMEKENELVGCVQISYLPNLTFQGAWRAQLEGVRIHSHHRGKGLGKQLIKEAIKQATAFGCRFIQLTTSQLRSDAIAFYESLGFQSSHMGLKLEVGADS